VDPAAAVRLAVRHEVDVIRAELHRPRDVAIEEVREPRTRFPRDDAAGEVDAARAIRVLRPRLVRDRKIEKVTVPVVLLLLPLHHVFVAG
jgi:hypothetical protein